jgi:hypothetical protein
LVNECLNNFVIFSFLPLFFKQILFPIKKSTFLYLFCIFLK